MKSRNRVITRGIMNQSFGSQNNKQQKYHNGINNTFDAGMGAAKQRYAAKFINPERTPSKEREKMISFTSL